MSIASDAFRWLRGRFDLHDDARFGATARLDATGRTRDGWTEYRLAGTAMTGWLCPNLGLYFEEAPSALWVRVSERNA